ncbi:hypothetical protein NXS19_006101 [Fusarium pseudograminearum]|nr:hypothetical protein NXS19_006101 [Fusarium pseudograminearum]
MFCGRLMVAFLGLAEDNKEFVWEKTYRLKQISVENYHASVGSELKPGITMFRRISSDDKSVCVRDNYIPKPREWEGPSEWASQIMKSV